MTTTIPDLWADDIKVDVLTRLAILRYQESVLEQKTQGILRAKVSTTTDDWVQHQLDLIAPVLDHYRVTVLTAKHHKDRVYPVTIRAECFAPQSKVPFPTPPRLGGGAAPPPDQREASTQDEFIELVREVLRSGQVRSLTQSLIAQSNELRTPTEASDERQNAKTDKGNGGTGKMADPDGSAASG